MEIANAKLSQPELDALVAKMFTRAGGERRMSLSFDDFSDVMSTRHAVGRLLGLQRSV